MRFQIALSLRIALGYFGAGICWILFSDRLVEALLNDPRQWTRWATIKGCLYVAITAALLFLLLRRTLGRLQSSEQKWKLLFDAAPDAQCLLGPSGELCDCNRQAELLWGRPKRQLIGRDPLEFLLPEERQPILRLLESNARGQIGGPTLLAIKAKDGRPAFLELRSYPVEIEHQPTMLAIMRDITEQRQAEAELRQSEARFGALFRDSPIAIGITTVSEGRLIEANEALAKLVGELREQLIGRTTCEVGLWPSSDTRLRFVELIRQHGRVENHEMRFRRTSGETLDLLLFAQFIDLAGERFLLVSALDVTARTEAARTLLRHETELSTIYEHSPLMICVVNSKREVERMNRTMREFFKALTPELPLPPGDLFGCVQAKISGSSCGHSPGCERCPLPLAIFTTLQTGKTCRNINASLVLHNGSSPQEVCIRASTALVRFEEQPKVLLFFEDVTSRKELERQLMQAQKMEAIGQLAGGVAHDFNNIVGAMLLHLQFLQMSPDLPSTTSSSLKELELCLNRAAALTRQLLVFGRRQALEFRRVELGQIIEGLAQMLKRLIGEHIEMTLREPRDPVWVEADPGMLEQIIMNLCLNARDAMPQGGTLSLSPSAITVHPRQATNHPEARPGRFACLKVTDTGCGMDATTLSRIFEPFFTTKPVGKGTGLGLATVYGIVHQHRGWIEVDSAVGKGTTFRVLLPLCAESQQAMNSVELETPGGSETILLVEDDKNLRTVAKATLTRLGYSVREASTGPEAVLVAKELGMGFDLMLTDMVMPGGMNGLELAEELRKMKPDFGVVVTSGYSTILLDQIGEPSALIKFLPKPYTLAALARTLRDLVDSQKTRTSQKV